MKKANPTPTNPTARKIRLPYPKDQNGNPLCRWCKKPVLAPRKSWCSDGCVTEYRERYDATYQRKQVKKRDKGVCGGCGIDCVRLARDVMGLYRADGELAAKKKLVEAGLRATDLRWKGWRRDRLRPLWQADHMVPVVEGGGGSNLTNLRTLCLECHRKVTHALMARRRKAKKK